MRGTLSMLQSALPGARATADAQFEGVSTDSRNVAAGNLFVALRGERFDAHEFLEQVVTQGAAAVVAERLPEHCTVPALLVPDTRVALGQIGNYWRKQFAIPLIGVTGSNGKTTVKEMIAAILEVEFGADNYLATRGNFNNEVGVPLTLLRLHDRCRAAVVELGMNHPGEIAVLSSIAQAQVGLVNNAQREHQEFMASVEAVAEENGAVITHLPKHGKAVFPADDTYTALWRAYAAAAGADSITFGLSSDADVHCTYTSNDFGSDMQVTACGAQFVIRLAAAGVHNVRNALAAIACTLAIGVASDAIVRGLQSFAPVNGRLQRKTASNGALVIDDTYNANPDSVRAAIEVLAHAKAPRILVLGDMGEVGDEGRQYHEEIGAYARACGIEQLMTLGELAQYAAATFGSGAVHHKDIAALNAALTAQSNHNTTVLVKGSRFMKMERAVQHLLGQTPREVH
ncbi:MAG TPA: UDP-N-acetylmuramoyl-tripeptide--D-alanyl-D-alanine ligase [Oxalicibacterium sp.]|nr:UDP-N-acetylmuramoyl-tripeptide--D-alanyl-D-alanine ligase [Oxalicibacterium sp.]